jgi:ABC-2 type transport system ATP-binding protein
MRGFLRSLAGEGRTVLVSSHLLSEVAQTVDDVVVLSKGHVIAETTLAELAGRSSVVRARTTDATRLVDVLLAAGIQVRLVDGDTVEARGAGAEVIGLAAAGAGLPILELSRHDEDLETLFFNLVHDRQEVAA